MLDNISVLQYLSPIMTCSTQKLKNAAGAAVMELAKITGITLAGFTSMEGMSLMGFLSNFLY